MPLARLAVPVLAVSLALTGCAPGDDAAVEEPVPAVTDPATEVDPAPAVGGADEAAEDAVVVGGFRFQPPSLAVPAGTTVIWTNEDSVRHTVTAGTPDAAEDTFDVELTGDGGEGTHTFAEAGTYDYFCRLHPAMVADVVVE